MITRHYGIYVDSEIPITGVCQHNQTIYDAMHDSDSIDLAWEEHKLECSDYLKDEYCECMLGDSSGDILIGSWKFDPTTEQYDIDPSGEYAAIVGELYTQVVFSQYVTRCNLCSPCYPGQGDLDSNGAYLTYALPPDMREEPTIIACLGSSLHSDLGLGL